MEENQVNNYIFCTEYGLEPAVYGYNIGNTENADHKLVIINKKVAKTVKIFKGNPKDYTPDKTQEYVTKQSTLYDELIILHDFLGNNRIYVGKRTDLEFRRIFLGFGDRYKILHYYYHGIKFNIWDRAEIKGFLSHLPAKQEEVLNLLYSEIVKKNGKEKFLSILEVIIEYKSRFLDLLVPYEEKFLDVPEGLLNANGSNGTNTNGINGTDGTNTNPTNGKATTANNNLLLGLGLLAVGAYALKKKKVI